MLFCVWTFPEVGPFGNYLFYIWNALKMHCVLIDMHGRCMACKPYMSGDIPMFRGTYLVYYVITGIWLKM